MKKPEAESATAPVLEEIWGRVSDRLGQFIRTRVADLAMAEDILHDVFVKLQKRLRDFQDPAKIEGWLFLVARNAVIDHYRTRKPMSELPESLPVDLPEADAIEIAELHAKLGQIIGSLPKEYREAFVLTAFEGYSLKDLAQQLGISLSAAKSRVQRARERVKEMVVEFCRREFSRTPDCQPCPRGLFTMPKMATPSALQNSKHNSRKSKRRTKGKSHV